MHSRQITWNPQAGWTPVKAETEKVSLVFYFGTRQMLACGKRFSELREMFPAAHILGCSTGGQHRIHHQIEQHLLQYQQ